MAPRGPILSRNQTLDRSGPSRLTGSSTTVDVGDDMDTHEAEGSNEQKKRGRSFGQSILKAIAKNGGKKLQIEFPKGLARPVKNATLLASGVGIIIRHHARLKNINGYDDISSEDKDQLYGGLMAWFEFIDIETNPLVKYKLDDIFWTSYRHWKNKMHGEYRVLKDTGQNPKDSCPYDWFEEDTWDAVCDLFETTKFKRRSTVNKENRSKLPYTHASGSKSFHVRYHEMETPSHVANWKICHTKKSGEMVNYTAELLAEKMKAKKEKCIEAGEPVVEEDILAETLGRKVGYSKGMGYGFEPPQSTRRVNGHNLEALKEAQELLQEQQTQLTQQQQTIVQQNVKIEEQNFKIEEQNSTIGTLLKKQNMLEAKMEKFLAAFEHL